MLKIGLDDRTDVNLSSNIRRSTEPVVKDHVVFHPHFIEGENHRIHHGRWAAQMEMDKPFQAVPVVPLIRAGQGDEILEIVVFLFQGQELFVVEHLLPAPGPVPEGEFAAGIDAVQLVEDMAAHGGHAGTAADEAHLVAGGPGHEVPGPGWGFGARAVVDRKTILENEGLENRTYFTEKRLNNYLLGRFLNRPHRKSRKIIKNKIIKNQFQ